jgi:monoamine oxidase
VTAPRPPGRFAVRARNALRGVSVVIAGAGLAGLTAARQLLAAGADVRIIEPRGRIGGRVWTVRDSALGSLHAEAGGELIDGSQTTLRTLVSDLDLSLVRVLKEGFGLVTEVDGRMRMRRSQHALWRALRRLLAAEIHAFDNAERDWQSSVGQALARRSLAETLKARRASSDVSAMAKALRGLYLADPTELSTLVAVEQLRGGNDLLIDALARPARGRIALHHAVRAVVDTSAGVRIAVENGDGLVDQIEADYLVATAPVSVLRTWRFDPALRDTQRRAFETLSYGPATKALLRFDAPWWRRRNQPRAFGTTLPIGAVWESGEKQRGGALLTLLAGGAASAQLREILDRDGAEGISRRLQWLGRWEGAPPSVWSVSWEADPWARGGYAVFNADFDPAWHFELARAHGRVVFAGEHTSRDWQGYMNGAVESGLRAAREIEQLHTIGDLRT